MTWWVFMAAFMLIYLSGVIVLCGYSRVDKGYVTVRSALIAAFWPIALVVVGVVVLFDADSAYASSWLR